MNLPRLRAARRVLAGLGLFETLAPFGPVLAGTFPLGVDVEGSDLDILCHAPDLGAFTCAAESAFGGEDGFRVGPARGVAPPAVVARFARDEYEIELFGQGVPVAEQAGFRHMIVEARLLAIGGEEARAAIRALKRAGLKTEPAFARHFGIAGDPYAALLALHGLDDAALRAALRGGDPRDVPAITPCL